MMVMLIAAVATTAVVTFPFIERKMRLGLVESILQLRDASPTITSASSFDDYDGLLMLAYCSYFWRWDLWLFLLLLLLLMIVILMIVAAIAVLKVLLPNIVLVEIDFVFVVVVLVLVRGNVPILRVAAVLGTDCPRGRLVFKLGAALLLPIGRRVRDQLRRTELNGVRWGATQ